MGGGARASSRMCGQGVTRAARGAPQLYPREPQPPENLFKTAEPVGATPASGELVGAVGRTPLRATLVSQAVPGLQGRVFSPHFK